MHSVSTGASRTPALASPGPGPRRAGQRSDEPCGHERGEAPAHDSAPAERRSRARWAGVDPAVAVEDDPVEAGHDGHPFGVPGARLDGRHGRLAGVGDIVSFRGQNPSRTTPERRPTSDRSLTTVPIMTTTPRNRTCCSRQNRRWRSGPGRRRCRGRRRAGPAPRRGSAGPAQALRCRRRPGRVTCCSDRAPSSSSISAALTCQPLTTAPYRPVRWVRPRESVCPQEVDRRR
jgi:hypothetical protein